MLIILGMGENSLRMDVMDVKTMIDATRTLPEEKCTELTTLGQLKSIGQCWKTLSCDAVTRIFFTSNVRVVR